MRKVLFILIAIVVILLVLPFALSRVIQSKYEQGIAALNADSSKSGFTLKVSGRDRNDIENYIGEMFNEALAKQKNWNKE